MRGVPRLPKAPMAEPVDITPEVAVAVERPVPLANAVNWASTWASKSGNGHAGPQKLSRQRRNWVSKGKKSRQMHFSKQRLGKRSEEEPDLSMNCTVSASCSGHEKKKKVSINEGTDDEQAAPFKQEQHRGNHLHFDNKKVRDFLAEHQKVVISTLVASTEVIAQRIFGTTEIPPSKMTMQLSSFHDTMQLQQSKSSSAFSPAVFEGMDHEVMSLTGRVSNSNEISRSMPSNLLETNGSVVDVSNGFAKWQEESRRSLRTSRHSMYSRRRSKRLYSVPTCSDRGAAQLPSLYGAQDSELLNLVGHRDIEKSFGGGNFLAHKAVDVVETFFQWWQSFEEPEHSGPLNRLVSSSLFESICMIAIIVNSGVGAYVADWEIQNIGNPNEPPLFNTLEAGFLIFFVVELLLRLAARRCFFFVGYDMKWNIFDLVVVTLSSVDYIFHNELIQIKSSEKSNNVGFMRLIRLLKMVRVLRSLRSFRFVKSLSELLENFRSSFSSLVWGFIMLAFVLYLFALLFVQALVEYLSEHDNLDPDVKHGIELRFGSLTATCLSLYMAVTGGDDWAQYYDIICLTGAAYGFLFLVFTFVFIFALFNILTGSVVDKAMSASVADKTDLILHQRKQFIEQQQRFREISKVLDMNCDGKITWDEFEEKMCNPVMLTYMASMGIELRDVELFFAAVGRRAGQGGKLIHAGEITTSQFVEGCMHMRGSATAIDMQKCLFEMHNLRNDVRDLEDVCRANLGHLEQLVGKSFHA